MCTRMFIRHVAEWAIFGDLYINVYSIILSLSLRLVEARVSGVYNSIIYIYTRSDDQIWCIYYFVWMRHENMSPCSRVNDNYVRIASYVGDQPRTWNIIDINSSTMIYIYTYMSINQRSVTILLTLVTPLHTHPNFHKPYFENMEVSASSNRLSANRVLVWRPLITNVFFTLISHNDKIWNRLLLLW